MSSGGRLISRIPGEGLSVIPVVEGGTPTAAMIAGAQAVTPFSFVPSWTGTKAELLAQIEADPTVLVDDGPRFSAYLSKIIELGHPLAYRGMIYINSYNPVTVAGPNVDLRQFGDGCIVGGPDLDNRLLKIINTGGDFARLADCHIDGMKFNVEKCAPGSLNSINCLEVTGFRTVLVENCNFYHGEFYQTAGGDSGVFLACRNATLRNNHVQGSVDLGFYISGSFDGLTDNSNLIIEGNTFINCANGWSAKRNYRYVRSVGNHYVGCRNGSSITATPVGGTGLGTIGGSLGIMAAETHENCGASCIDLRETHGWNVQCTVAGTFGYDKDGVAVASACIVKLDDADNCRVDFVAEVTSTDVTHAAVRIQNGSVNNVVNGTVKGIYNGLLETNGNYNNVTLKLDADVTVPGTIFGANTQFTYDQEGVRSYYVGVYDRLPGRSPFNASPLSGSVVFNFNTAQRTVQIEPAASSVKAILPVAVNGDEVTIHKTAASGVGLIQVRDPTDTTTIHNIVDAGAMASFRYGPTGWVFLSRSISDNALPLVTVAAANVATPAANCKTLFIDSADGAVKAKDSAGAVQAYALDSDVAALGDTVETLALTASVEYPTIADGLAATTEGGYFVVRESGNNYATRYQKVGGVEVFDNALASKAGVEDAVGAVQAEVGGMSVALRASYSTLAQVAATGNFAAADNFRRWGVGIDIGTDVVPTSALTAVALRLQLGTGGTKVRLRLWLRPLSSASLDANPGTASDDALLLMQDYSAASLGITAGGTAVDARMALPFDVSAGTLAESCLIIDVEGLDGSDAQVLLGVGNRANPTGLPTRKRGWYFNNLGWGFIASDNAVVLAWKLEKSDTFSGTANDTRVTVIEGRATVLETGKVATDASISSLNSALTTTFTNRGEVARNSIRGTGPYTRWFFGGDVGTEIASGYPLTHLLIALATYNTTTTQVRLTVLLRDLASGALNTAGQQSGDVQYGPYTYSLASVSNGVLPAVGASADCRLLMGAGVPASALPGKRVYFFIEGLDAASAYSAIGTGFTTTASGTVEQGKRGYFGASSLANSISSPERIAYRVEQAVMATSAELAAAISAGAQVPALVAKVDPTIPSDLLLPDKLWMTAGRVLPFAARSMYSKRVDGPVLDVSVESLRYLPTSAQATAPKPGLAVRGYGTLPIDPDAVTTSVKVTARRLGVGNTRLQKTIPVSVAPWIKTGSPVIMGIGDSLMAQSKMSALLMELQARGMTPTMRGSLATNFNGQGTTVCEGRGGKAMADFLNIRAYSSADANTMQPCNDITLAQYNALPADGGAGVDARANRNPFLVAGSGEGYYNGFKFSIAQYAAFFGIDLSTLTHVFVSLGTNDIFQFAPSTALANIATGIQLMVAEIRAVAPNAHIIFVSDGCGWRDGINDAGQYYETHHDMMQTQQATVAALADSKVYYVPIGLHQDDNRFGAMTTSTTDGYGVMTVVDSVVEAGYVHPTDGNILVGASVLASLVAATTP